MYVCIYSHYTNKKSVTEKKRFARKCRRRTRPERRRIAKTSQNVSRARSRTGELNIATWNVRSLSLTGRRGAGHAEVLLQKCKVIGCDVIGLQETRRPGRTEFATAGYRVFCSGVDGSTGRTGQHGVGLAVKESIFPFWIPPWQRCPLQTTSTPASFCLLSFLFFSFPTVFAPNLVWCNFLYLVTTAGLVADQLIMWDENNVCDFVCFVLICLLPAI